MPTRGNRAFSAAMYGMFSGFFLSAGAIGVLGGLALAIAAANPSWLSLLLPSAFLLYVGWQSFLQFKFWIVSPYV